MGSDHRENKGIPYGFPFGRRTPQGKLRWYLAHAPRGREQATCDKVLGIVSPDVLDDAFVMRKERWRKLEGVWRLQPVEMYEEYFFVATRDVAALDREFSKLSFPVHIAGFDEHSYVPLSVEAQQWYEDMMDESHTLRNSTAVIQDGVLHVQDGPLVGQELRVRKINRHKRDCRVAVCGSVSGEFAETLPLEVPFKS